jgi:hypothetical protein
MLWWEAGSKPFGPPILSDCTTRDDIGNWMCDCVLPNVYAAMLLLANTRTWAMMMVANKAERLKPRRLLDCECPLRELSLSSLLSTDSYPKVLPGQKCMITWCRWISDTNFECQRRYDERQKSYEKP